MTKQTNGWQDRAIHHTYNTRAKRNKEIARLKRERVNGDEHTPAELEAIHAQLKADFYARNPEAAR